MLKQKAKELYIQYGQQKQMGNAAIHKDKPHFFLLRTFVNQNDLLIIFNTKRCRYQCHFCQLPTKSSKKYINKEAIMAQFEYVIDEEKHALSILDRITFSNEGSVLDTSTFSSDALLELVDAISEFRRVRTLVLETRLEFVTLNYIRAIQKLAPRITLDILTGFETHNSFIRDTILGKKETLETVQKGLDIIAEVGANFTAYILYKPEPTMTDEAAFIEAEKSIDYIREECNRRNIPLLVRINPMYVAKGSKWAINAEEAGYLPPKLGDIMRLAEKKAQEGCQIYIGLSTENLAESSYLTREGFSKNLIKQVILFNNGKLASFSL